MINVCLAGSPLPVLRILLDFAAVLTGTRLKSSSDQLEPMNERDVASEKLRNFLLKQTASILARREIGWLHLARSLARSHSTQLRLELANDFTNLRQRASLACVCKSPNSDDR